MASKKKQLPWRTLVEIPDDQFGRFTREQIREAVNAVKAEREEARVARARSKKPQASNAINTESSRTKARVSRAA